MDLYPLFLYLGVAVVLYAIGQLLHYWITSKEETYHYPWYQKPVEWTYMILLYLSFPVTIILVGLYQMYDKRREKEYSKQETEAALKGKQIGYAYGKAEGYSEGLRYGLNLEDVSTYKSWSTEDRARFAYWEAECKKKDPDWCMLPKYHYRWTLDELHLTDPNED